MELRPYQERVVSEAVERLEKYTRPFVVSAVQGSGKSLMIAELCKRIGKPVLVLCMNGVLVEQNVDKLRRIGVEPAVFSASLGEKKLGQITVGTIQSMYKFPQVFERFGLVVIDEVQTLDPSKINSMYMKLLQHIKPKIIGWTGTPWRTVSKSNRYTGQTWSEVATLNRIRSKQGFLWGEIYNAINYREMLDAGYLCKTKYFTDKLDTSMLRLNKDESDYTDESIGDFAKISTERVVDVAVGASKMCRKVLVCVPTIESALAGLSSALERNVEAVCVHSKMKPTETKGQIDAFRDTDTGICFQVGMLNTGYDDPKLDAIVLARPTLSVALYGQQVGRVLRKDNNMVDKVGHVFDLVGLTRSFGRGEWITIGKDGYQDVVRGDYGVLSGRRMGLFARR